MASATAANSNSGRLNVLFGETSTVSLRPKAVSQNKSEIATRNKIRKTVEIANSETGSPRKELSLRAAASSASVTATTANTVNPVLIVNPWKYRPIMTAGEMMTIAKNIQTPYFEIFLDRAIRF